MSSSINNMNEVYIVTEDKIHHSFQGEIFQACLVLNIALAVVVQASKTEP